MSVARWIPPIPVESLESRRLLAIDFAPPVISPIGGAQSIVVADFNRDGKADLVAESASSGSVFFYAGLGDGRFAPSLVSLPIDLGPNVVGLTVGDFNRDGQLDLAAANGSTTAGPGGVSVVFGNGNGTFTQGLRLRAGPSPTAIVVGDLNGDGRADLVVADNRTWPATTPTGTPGFGAAVLLGTATGFAPVMRLPLPVPTTAVASSRTVNAATGTVMFGGVAFAGELRTATDPLPRTLVVLVPGLMNATVAYPQFVLPGANRGLVAGPLNADRFFDVAALQVIGSNAGGTPAITVFTVASAPNVTSIATPGHVVRGPFATGQLTADGIAAGDFDRDGRLDVVVAGMRSAGPMLPAMFGAAAVLPGRGDGTLAPPIAFHAGFTPFGIAASELNRDGRLDLVVAGSGGVSSLLNRTPRPASFAETPIDEIAAGPKDGSTLPVSADVLAAV